jgi:penicillin-binding protein 1A
MFNMMQDVIRGGTGTRAMALGRVDLAGKTGTTNDQMDAWFAGFQRQLVAVAWVGYDIPKSLGEFETGSKTALPMWVSYMATALRGQREEIPIAPEGVTAVAINPETGLRDAAAGNQMIEYFYHENVPPEPGTGFLFRTEPARPSEEINDQLY